MYSSLGRPGTAPAIKIDSNNFDGESSIMSRTHSSRLLRSPINSGASAYGNFRSSSRPSTSSGALPGSGVTSLQLSEVIESVERLSTSHSDIKRMHTKIETMSRSGILADPIKTSELLQNPEMHREQTKKDILQNRLDEQSVDIEMLSDQLKSILNTIGTGTGASMSGSYFEGSVAGDGSVVSQLRDDDSLATVEVGGRPTSAYTDLRSWSSPQKRRIGDGKVRRVKTIGLPNKTAMTLPKHVVDTPYQPSLAAIISPPMNPVANLYTDTTDNTVSTFKMTTPRALARGSPNRSKASVGGTVISPSNRTAGSRPRSSSHDFASMHTRSNDTYHGTLRQDERLDGWVSSYDDEVNEKTFSSVSVYAELRMREAMEKTRNLPRPNGHRTAVAMDMLYQTIGVFGRYKELMRLIADELACSIYLTMKDLESDGPMPSRANIDNGIPYFEVHTQMTAETQALRGELLKTQEVGGALGLQQMSKRNNGLVKRIQDRQKLVVRNIGFFAWQGYYYDLLDRRHQQALRRARRLIKPWFLYFKSQKRGAEGSGGTEQVRAKFMRLEQEIEEARGETEALIIEKKQLYQLLAAASEDTAVAGKLTNLIQKGSSSFNSLDEGQLKTMGSSEGGLAAGLHTTVDVATQTRSNAEKGSPGRRGVSGVWQRAFDATKRRGAIVVGEGGDVLGAEDEEDGGEDGAGERGGGGGGGGDGSGGGGGKSGGSGGNGGGGRTPKGLEALLGKAKKGADKKVKEIPIQLANTLITTIYEAKIKQDQDDALEGRPLQSLPEFARDCLIRKYGIKSLATKYMRSLVFMCRGKGSTSSRLRLFSGLCAIPTDTDIAAGNVELVYSTTKVALFSELIGHLFPSSRDVGIAMGNNSGIDRDLVLTAFANTFTAIRKKNTDEYKETARALLALPAKDIVKGREGSKTRQTVINVDDAMELIMKVWEAEQQQKSIAVFEAMQASQQKGGAGSGDPTKRQSSLLKGLVSKFNQKQREHRRLRVERLVNLFREWDLEFHANDATGEFSLPEFQEMLEHGMDLDMDNRRYLEIYNEWEDACDTKEQEMAKKLEDSGAGGEVVVSQTTRASEFANVMLHNMLYVKEDDGEPLKPEAMAPATRREHSPSVANLMGNTESEKNNFLKLGALFEAQNAESNETDTGSDMSESESTSCGMSGGDASSEAKTPALSFDI
jgi:hypothetical protein